MENTNQFDIEEVVELEIDFEQVGPRGLSAYEVYLETGGTLSETEWLLSLKGEKGITPTIGENGNWFIGDVDTGLPSRGEKGEEGLSEEQVKNITGELEVLNTNAKSNLVDSINELFDSNMIYVFEETDMSVFSMINGSYPNNLVGSSLSAKAEEQIQNAINSAYNKGLNSLILVGNFIHGGTISNSRIITFTKYSGSPLQKKPTTLFFNGLNTLDNNSYTGSSIRLYLSWNSDNVATITSSSAFGSVGSFLSKTNTSSYNPTKDFHPSTKLYVDQSIKTLREQILQFNILVVDELPIEDISINTIYLIPKSSDEEDNVYYEYLYINDKWEKIGDTKIDLTNYATKDFVRQTAVLKVYEGKETDYEILSQEEKDNYDVAILQTLAELDESILKIISNIIGEETETTIDMTEQEIDEQLNRIIGGE